MIAVCTEGMTGTAIRLSSSARKIPGSFLGTVGESRGRLATRRQWRVVEKITTIDPPADAVDARPEEYPRADCLRNALARLSTTDAEVLRLWAWEELAPLEIATALDISVIAATIRLHRAKKKLRQEMDRSHRPTTTKRGDR